MGKNIRQTSFDHQQHAIAIAANSRLKQNIRITPHKAYRCPQIKPDYHHTQCWPLVKRTPHISQHTPATLTPQWVVKAACPSRVLND